MAEYPHSFPYKGEALTGISRNQDLVPAFLVIVVQVADWWSHQNVAGTERLRLARHLRQAYITVEEISEAMKDPAFWTNPDIYGSVKNLKDLLDRLSPTGLYFGPKENTFDTYGFWSDDILVGPLPLWL